MALTEQDRTDITDLINLHGHLADAGELDEMGELFAPDVTYDVSDLGLMIKLVPNSLREAALALGYPRWRTSLSVVIRTTLPGILTGALLAIARIAGETAPLLFTALGSQYLSFDLNQPMAALPLVVFNYATGPFEEWHQYAWAAALVLIIVVFVLSLGARLAIRSRYRLNA